MKEKENCFKKYAHRGQTQKINKKVAISKRK